MLLERRLSVPEMVRRLSLVDSSKDIDDANVRRWVSKKSAVRPNVFSAWRIGQALQADDGEGKALLGTSGLVALYWFDYVADFVGVLGACDRQRLLPFTRRIMAMLRTVQWTDYVSPFDVLPPDHEVFIGEVNKQQLEQIVAVKIHEIDVANLEHEATFLNNRRLALKTWDLPSDLRDVILAGATTWFGEPNDEKSKKGMKGMRAAPAPFAGQPESMRAAYALARSDIEWDMRWSLIIGSMTAYLYDHPDISKPVLDDVRFVVSACPCPRDSDSVRCGIRALAIRTRT